MRVLLGVLLQVRQRAQPILAITMAIRSELGLYGILPLQSQSNDSWHVWKPWKSDCPKVLSFVSLFHSSHRARGELGIQLCLCHVGKLSHHLCQCICAVLQYSQHMVLPVCYSLCMWYEPTPYSSSSPSNYEYLFGIAQSSSMNNAIMVQRVGTTWHQCNNLFGW